MTSPPFVTIAMPCFNEAMSLEACLRSVLAQDYPSDRVEILIADGMSTDATRDILARFSAEDPRIHVIDSPARTQAAGLNAALQAARGDIILRMDAHCEYQNDYVRKCVEVLERTGADNVGGAQRVKARTLFQRALGAALKSPLGVGGARYRSENNEGFVDTVFLGGFRRRVFEMVGTYDPRAVPNEDAELNQRILAAGGRIYLSREIVVHYYPRRSFGPLAWQYFRYGKSRARTLLKHRTLPSLRSVVPFLTLMGGAILLATSHLHDLSPLALGLYAGATLLEAIRMGRRAGLAAVPVAWVIFPVLHASHGLGFAVGLVRHGLRQDWEKPGSLSRAWFGRTESQAR